MKLVLVCYAFYYHLVAVTGFWDTGTTTPEPYRTDKFPRQSFFRWQEVQPNWRSYFFWYWDWAWLRYNRKLNVVAGVSHGFLCLGTATILNKRTLITASNLLDDHFNVQRELRIWALGSRGEYYTPYRYRVWRVSRLFQKSVNPEHWHGPRGRFSPRHDVSIIHTLDQMMTTKYVSTGGHYPHRSFLISKRQTLRGQGGMWFTGSGYEYMEHIRENYKIFITSASSNDIVDCSKYLPKFWGKFICMVNANNFPGIQNGGGLHIDAGGHDLLAGLGCFEIRYNEDRIYAFTDLRYYLDFIYKVTEIYVGEYYEYAYPQWGMSYGYLWNSKYSNYPTIPKLQPQKDLYPMG